MTVTLATLRDEGLWTGVALRLPIGTTTAEASEIGGLLGELHTSVQFAMGDFIIECEKLFGEEAYQVIESLNLSEESRAQYVRVALAIPPPRRRNELTWSHHRAVYALGEEDADALLVSAIEGGWSKYELEAAKRNGAEPAFRVNTRLVVEVATAIVASARPTTYVDYVAVEKELVERLGELLRR